MNRRTLKLVLLSVLAVGVIGSVTVHGVYALLSSQTSNSSGSVASGTLTANNVNVGVIQTTLTGAITNAQTSITVASATGFPASGNYTISVGKELMTVTAGQGTTTWTVTRGASGTTAAAHASGAIVVRSLDTVSASTTLSSTIGVGATTLATSVPETTLTANVPAAFPTTTLAAAITTTTATSITVSSAAGFPTSGSYTIQIDSEQMTVTAGQGTTTWTVTRHANGTTAATHSNAATVAQVSISVSSASGFPGSGNYTILVDSEQMTVTAGQGTTLWTVTRAANSTTAAVHSTGATVDPTTISVAANTNFPGVGTSYAIRVDNEVMTVTAGQGGTAWTVTRGANGTSIAAHSAGASVLQKTVFVSSDAGFPASGDYTVLVDSEKMLVTGGQGTTTWTVARDVDGTSAAGHTSSTAVTTNTCKSLNGSPAANVNTGCDAVLAWAPDSESYPGTPISTSVAVTDSGSVPVSDLRVYMPSCLRAVTPDAPFSAPSISSFGSASTTGGYLAGGTPYYYEVTSVTPSGESVAGSEATYTPPAGTSTNQITLNWSAVSGATGYKIYRSTTEGGEQLLATVGAVTSYADTTNATPSGSPPAGTGSGNPCLTGTAQVTIQETTPRGTQCWYPSTNETCAFDGTLDLGAFAANHTAYGTGIDLGAGPAALGTRYFQISVQFPTTASNALQGTDADFTLYWYALS